MGTSKRGIIYGDNVLHVTPIEHSIIRRRPTGRLILTMQRAIPEIAARRLAGESMNNASTGLRRILQELKNRGIEYGPFRL